MRERMPSIGRRLLLLAAAILVPAALAAAFGLAQLYQAQRAAAEQTLRQITQALAVVIDTELAQRRAVLETLARSPALLAGNLAAHYEYARTMAPTFERTIILAELDGDQVYNTRLPFGAPTPQGSTLFKALRDRLGAPADAPLVSDLYFAPVGKRFSFAIQVPVQIKGKLVYYLNMGTYADTLQKLLADQRLRPGWNASVLDRQGSVVARLIDPERFVGKPATADMRRHLSAAPEGLFETVRLDGVRTLTAYTPVGTTGWTFVVSMPKADLYAALARAVGYTTAILLLLFALAAYVASRAARSISRPMHALVEAAAAVGRNESPPPFAHALREPALVAAELERAGSRIRSAQRELELRVDKAVADSRRAQEALLQAQKMEALGRLTGGIAHDFNNLLQTISMAVELALRERPGASAAGALESARRAVQSASKLTRQLTTFGRGTPAELRTCDLRDQVLRLRELVTGALRGDISLEVDLAGDLWPVTIDPVQLELALLNAALNARDAMPRGGRFLVSAANVRIPAPEGALDAGEYVRLTLADTGEGIAPEHLPHVFDPFFTTKDVGKGSGLGLAQIYGFATQSGGTAAIESEPGRGTRLLVWLPRAAAPAAPASGEAAREAPARVAGAPALLLVEDDALVVDVVRPALEAEGFRVLAVHDAAAALRAIERQRFDIVFSDIVMPGGTSGIELARQAAARQPGLAIVLATGYADAAEMQDAPARVLAKPYRLEDLKRALIDAMAGAPA